MPTYDYKCTKCAETFEAFNKIADRKVSFCPTCEGIGVQQISAPMTVLDDSFPGQHMKWGRERKKMNGKL